MVNGLWPYDLWLIIHGLWLMAYGSWFMVEWPYGFCPSHAPVFSSD